MKAYLKGKVREIEKLANNIAALKGVKLSRVNIMTMGEHLAWVSSRLQGISKNVIVRSETTKQSPFCFENEIATSR